MKNLLILLGLVLYVIGVFLPWGPIGSKLESGFNEEGSPGIIGILPAIIATIFGLKSTKKSYLITLVIGVLMILFPITLFSKIAELANHDYLAIKYGVYLLFFGAIIVIYGALQGRKKLNSENNHE